MGESPEQMTSVSIDISAAFIKGMRWTLLKDRSRLKPEAATDLNALVARQTSVRAARAWLYKERPREILQRQDCHLLGRKNRE